MFTDRKEEKRKKELEFWIKRMNMVKDSKVACYDFIVIGRKIESLEKIRNENDIILKNNKSKVDMGPLETEVIKLEEQFEKAESVYLKKKGCLEMEFGKPLSHIKV